MASSFIACYLFLAGGGAGAFLIAAVVDGALRFRSTECFRRLSPLTDPGLALGPVVVAFGCVFLLCDLGSPGKAFAVFAGPPRSLLGWGAWSVVVFCASASGAWLCGRSSRPFLCRCAEPVLQIAACMSAAFVAGYSGVYLSLFPAVPFLHTPWIPLLFVASAFATGMGLLVVTAFVRHNVEGVADSMGGLSRVDACLTIFEAAALLSFCIDSVMAGDVVSCSLEMMVSGPIAPVFWLGVVICGLVFPLAADIVSRHVSSPPLLAVAGCSKMVGGLCLRFVVLLAAVRYGMVNMSVQSFWM
ncbi:MAG: polysulfide reductase NrfD [Slackia sp.]|nr:polysulfide reductase NrfD [Slackia sp.]